MSRFPALEVSFASDEEDDEDVNELPINWQVFFDGEGRCFYHNSITGVSQYDYPAVSLTDSPLANSIDNTQFFDESPTANISVHNVRNFNLSIETSTVAYSNDHSSKTVSSNNQYVSQSMPLFMLDSTNNASPKSMSPKYQHASQSISSSIQNNANNVSPKTISPKYQHASQSMPSYMLDRTNNVSPKSMSPKYQNVQSHSSNMRNNANYTKSMSPKNLYTTQSMPSYMLGNTNNISLNSVSPKNQHATESMPSYMLDSTSSLSPKSSLSMHTNANPSIPPYMIDDIKNNASNYARMPQDHGEIISMHKLQINDSHKMNNNSSLATTLLENTPTKAASIVYYSDMEEYSDMDNDEDEKVSMKNEINYVSPRYWLQPARSNKDHVNKQVRLNQDYLALAREYTRLKPYTDHNSRVTCVICSKFDANIVFFPCEHRCVCKTCIKNEKICEDRMLSSVSHGHSNCPVCAQIIKLILPHDHGKVLILYLHISILFNLLFIFRKLINIGHGYLR